LNYQIRPHTIPTPYLVGPIHIYEVTIGDETILFDTGPPTSEGLQYLLEHIDIEKLSAVLVTHFHPDHYGLLSEIEKRSDATLIVPKKDLTLLENSDQRSQFICAYMDEIGFPDKIIRELQSVIPSFHTSVPKAKKYQLLERSGKILDKYGIMTISCPGHSQTDNVYIFGGNAVTGDILLKNIFQAPILDLDVDIAHSRFQNYYHYCRSIYKLKQLETFKILPSHNEKIESVSQQISFYANKIIERSSRLLSMFENGDNVFQVLNKLFPEMSNNAFKLYIKASEVIFLKDYLERPNLLQQALADNEIQI